MLKELIYEFFDNERKRKEEREIDYNKKFNIAPSYLTDCIRKIYYKKMNINQSNPISLHSYIKFSMGDAVHEKLGEILQKVTYIKRGEIWQEKNLHGCEWIYRVDNYIIAKSIEHIIEIKSIYGNTAHKELPREKDIIQLFCYLLLEKLDNGILLYICRDTGFIEEFHFNIEKLKKNYGEKYKERLNKLKQVKEKYNKQDKIPPEKEYKIVLKNLKGEIKYKFQKDKVDYKTDFQCDYCSWKDYCWKEELEKIKDYNFYIDGNFY